MKIMDMPGKVKIIKEFNNTNRQIINQLEDNELLLPGIYLVIIKSEEQIYIKQIVVYKC